MARKKTRAQKQAEGKSAGTSKYARKIRKRHKLAQELGFVGDIPYPILLSTEVIGETPTPSDAPPPQE